MKSWRAIAPKEMKIIPIVGQIAKIGEAELKAYQRIIDANHILEIHFYSYTANVPKGTWKAIRALGTATAVA
jgi:hypothetical protein